MSTAIVLRRSGMSKKQVGKELHLSRSTVASYEQGNLPETADKGRVMAGADKVAAELVDKLDHILPKILDAAEGKIGETGFKDLLIGFGIGTQRREGLKGYPGAGADRTVRVIFSADPSVSSLQGLGERAVSGTKALPETIEGAFYVEEPDKT